MKFLLLFVQFKYGSKLGNKYLSHLTLGRLFLNSHQFVPGFGRLESLLKSNKNSSDNNASFVLNCESPISQRNVLFNKIELLLSGFKVKGKKLKLLILLNGICLDSEFPDCKNKHIMFAMQHFQPTPPTFTLHVNFDLS